MAERVVVYQDRSFRTQYKAADPQEGDTDVVDNVMHLHNLTPYGMLLASLGTCTAIVVNTYARNHDIPLRGVTVDVDYGRVYAEDCDDCEMDTKYEEVIRKQISFEGELESAQIDRLHQVAKACSVSKMLANGIRIESE